MGLTFKNVGIKAAPSYNLFSSKRDTHTTTSNLLSSRKDTCTTNKLRKLTIKSKNILRALGYQLKQNA